ncbi:MAG: chemotaxis protein [Alishewanella sp.]|nr:chemotaxis protein [Alishewanella sp.]MDP5187927.1 chemotaxis protein [Alishewanella sp.]
MSNVLNSVNQRTNLAGQNRFELLLFRLNGNQLFGINVFKVREVIQAPELSEMPGSHACVKGIAQLRGDSVIVVDLSQATTGVPIADMSKAFVIVTEYNRHVQGFLVSGVDRIVNLNWDQIKPPPQGAGRGHYLTAVTEIEKQLIQIIDVEKVFSEIIPMEEEVSDQVKAQSHKLDLSKIVVLVADDSAVARNQVKRALNSVNVHAELVKDGQEALDWLHKRAESAGANLIHEVPLLISDIEMPRMDGYTLAAEIKADAKLKDIHIILHSSLSGVFNEAMVKKVGADQFIAKFHPDELLSAVNYWLEQSS